jgi:Ca2+-binding RTX toxin-like protein
LAEGDRIFTAQAIDAAGNASNQSNDFTVRVSSDLVPPAPPVITDPAETNDLSPTISGTAEANATVELFIGGVSVGTTTADGTGNWSVDITDRPGEGDYTVTATATDVANNTSGSSAPFDFTIDTTAPGVPTLTGNSPTDDLTPEVSGTAEADATVEIFVDGVSVGTTTADGNGNWSFSPPSDLAEGDRIFTAQAIDAAGNASGQSNDFTIRVSSDIVPPAAPTVTADTPINDRTPEFSGVAEPGATVEIFVDNVSVGTTTADGNGDWSFSPPSNLSEGDRSVSVTATDAAGNTSERSQPLSVRIDAQAPGAPTITGPSVTGDQTPTFSGTAEAGATVAVRVDGVEVGTTTASGTGEWTFELPTALGDGDYDVTATAEDAAGNVSSPSNTVSTTIDTTLPIVPTIEGDALTNDATPTLSGESEPGVTIEIFDGNTLVGTTTADGTGEWTFTFGDELPDGEYTFGVVARDAGGNESASVAPLAMVIDTTAPVAPTLTGETATNDTTPTFSGTAEPGTTLEVFDRNTSLGTTTVDGQGNWEFTPTTPLAEGEYDISAQATDAAGNTSPSSPVLDVLIDTTAPESPEFTGEVDASNNPPTFQGTAEPGTTIEVYDGDALVGRTTVDDSGEWSFTPEDPLEPGNREVTFRAIDPAGNESGLSDPISVFAEDVSGTLGVVLSATRLRLSEPTSIVEGDNLSTAPKVTTFTVALESQPSSDVVLNVSSSDMGEAALSTSTLTFTPANWDQPQTVTVRAIADEMYDVTQDVTVTVSVASANSARGFANMVDQTIAVAVEHVGPTPGSDRLVYGSGRDRVFGMADDDRINGGAGNDRLNGEGGSDRLFGGTGNDRLLGMAGADNLIGGAGDDRMLGGVGNDRLTGNAGNERMAGVAGADLLIGGAGNDTMLGGAANDRLLGGGGRDLMRGNVDNDVLNGGADNDRMFGGLGNDRLNGQGGDDLLRGGEGRDVLKGGSGNDRIAGEMGNDIIFSGAGRDRIILRQGQGFDRIVDFEDGFDRIVLAGIRFNDLTFQQQREGVLITNGNENVALLRNMNVGQLSQADFV